MPALSLFGVVGGDTVTGGRIDILYVITGLKIGGVPLHLARLARAMRARGFSVEVVSLTPGGAVAEMLEQEGIHVCDCGGRGGWDFRVIPRLADVIRKKCPPIVHAMLFHANVAARWAAHAAGLSPDRVLCEIQTVEVERRWHLWVERWTHFDCRLTIGNSPSVIEHLNTYGRIPLARLRLIRGGIDPAPYRNAQAIDRVTLGVPEDAPIILWAGRLDPVKGLTSLIAAFRTVADRTTAHLLLAGDGPLRQRLEEQIAQQGLARRVHLLGPRRDVPALLKAANLFAFPSRTEGLPNALLEAMAAGCPIVTTDVPGCRDLIQTGLTGLLVPYGDAPKLADALLSLLRNRDAATLLAGQAAKLVETQWNIAHTLDAYASLYEEVFGRLSRTAKAP